VILVDVPGRPDMIVGTQLYGLTGAKLKDSRRQIAKSRKGELYKRERLTNLTTSLNFKPRMARLTRIGENSEENLQSTPSLISYPCYPCHPWSECMPMNAKGSPFSRRAFRTWSVIAYLEKSISI
jgi:hypothetical protein